MQFRRHTERITSAGQIQRAAAAKTGPGAIRSHITIAAPVAIVGLTQIMYANGFVVRQLDPNANRLRELLVVVATADSGVKLFNASTTIDHSLTVGFHWTGITVTVHLIIR